ncbi:MAG TPA: hypothetical protein VHP99_04040 [Pyrinomonadaceae bacterium]|nr:hypothetical protein [Pyrinomonadaceae bacterium]
MQSPQRNRWLALFTSIALITAFSLEAFSSARGKKKKKAHGEKSAAVLWHDPGNIRTRDLYYGPGSKDSAPAPPFHFVKEVKEGGMPKFEVTDARGAKWRVKLGPEAQAETVSSRLVWAVGYNAEESYYFDRVRVDGMQSLSRGQKFVQGDSVVGARFEPRRKNVERGANWDWNKNPFKDTRELNGLKTMMVLLNNWDTFKKNNRVLTVKDTGEDVYTVTDLGATMGAARGVGGHRSKNNADDFARSRFVKDVKNGNVKYAYDLKPKKLGILSAIWPPYYFRQRKATNTMHKVPVQDAAWIGSQLSQLSDNQLRDTFRAAGYDKTTTDKYVRTLRGRINELNRLRDSEMASDARRNHRK